MHRQAQLQSFLVVAFLPDWSILHVCQAHILLGSLPLPDSGGTPLQGPSGSWIPLVDRLSKEELPSTLQYVTAPGLWPLDARGPPQS